MFGEDCEPLPEHLNEDGDIALPQTFGGYLVTGMAEGYLLGGLAPVEGHAEVTVAQADEASVLAALDELGWDRAASHAVLEALSGPPAP